MISYVPVDSILAKLYRDLGLQDIVEEDIVEWIGEALGFLEVYQTLPEVVVFQVVNNFETNLPKDLNSILRVSRDNAWTAEEVPKIVEEIEETCKKEISDCGCSPFKVELSKGFNWDFSSWKTSILHRERFTPVRLSENVFFNSIVCREEDETPYETCRDEYTIIGTYDKKLRFSFKTGFVAIAYLQNPVDPETGYPLIPDDVRYITAISYYIKWKMAQRYSWEGRAGYVQLAQDSERLWLKYVSQGKNYMKMIKTEDEYLNFIDGSQNSDISYLHKHKKR